MAEPEVVNPLFDNILVQEDKPPEKTAHGLYVADDKKQTSFRATVRAVGPGIMRDGSLVPCVVNVGDVVVYGRMHSGQNIKINDEDFLLMREVDLLATITKGN